MVHGRNSYKRSAALSQFVIHRSLCISTMQVNGLSAGFADGEVRKPNQKVAVLCLMLEATVSSPENSHGLELEVVTLI